MELNKAPMWRDARRLLVLTEEAVRRFPRYHEYTLGSDLRRQAMQVCPQGEAHGRAPTASTSAMATTTGTTRATTTESGWCAAESEAAGAFSLRELWQAYVACRWRKRGTRDAQRYDQQLLVHLVDTRQALATRQWCPHPSTWFVTLRPKAQEVHCVPFTDRVVHHWLVPRLEATFEPAFSHDSHSNRVGHGVLHAVDRLQGHLRRASANGKRPAWYLQLDIANFFNTVDRRHLYRLIRHRLPRQAGVLAQLLGAPLDSVPRRPFAATLSRPLKRRRGLRRHLRRQGDAHLFVAEEGHRRGGLKRRVLRLAWWPHPSPLPLWAEIQGV